MTIENQNAYDSDESLAAWKVQYALLTDGITDSRMHDSSLGFLGWYQHEHLYQLERRIIDIVRDSSLEDLTNKIEADIDNGSGKDKLLKVLKGMKDINEEFCSPTIAFNNLSPIGDTDIPLAEDTLTMSKLG